MVSIITLFVITLTITIIYIIINLLNKVKVLEARLEIEDANMKSLIELITLSNSIITSHPLVEAFRSNDEVGRFFNILQTIQNNLNKFKK